MTSSIDTHVPESRAAALRAREPEAVAERVAAADPSRAVVRPNVDISS